MKNAGLERRCVKNKSAFYRDLMFARHSHVFERLFVDDLWTMKRCLFEFEHPTCVVRLMFPLCAEALGLAL